MAKCWQREASRESVETRASRLRFLAYELLRQLDDEFAAVPPEDVVEFFHAL